MRHGSLFTGIGGFDLAAEWMAWINIFQVEKDKYCQKVLTKHFPTTKLYEEIKEFDAKQYRGAIDIITGGFPCQPFSTAGKRKGKTDERYLWPEMLGVIRTIRPRWVVAENVSGIVSWNNGLVFEQVQTDMEVEGYEVQPFVIPACAVNAPHRRDRVWFIAHSYSGYGGSIDRIIQSQTNQIKRPSRFKDRERLRSEPSNVSKDEFVTNARSQRQQKCNTTTITDEQGYPPRPFIKSWSDWPTESPICGGNDGLPYRLDRIKALGNAILPQIAYKIFRAIETVDYLTI